MIAPAVCAKLRDSKNLLAFSAGVDSSALFFLLCEHKIDFDIAFVNYHTRAQSEREELHAKNLAIAHNKQCFVYSAAPILQNFEHNARAVRYAFFESLIEQYGYTNLLLAHQLNDRLEWLLLSLMRGCGFESLLSSSEEIRQTANHTQYTLLRPLHDVPKNALYIYLHSRNLPFFEDSSNKTQNHQRNLLRPWLEPLVASFAPQIARSFENLESERMQFFMPKILHFEQLLVCKTTHAKALQGASKALKILGYVPTSAQRKEILRQNFHCVVGGKFAIGFARGFVFVAPFLRVTMIKPFKEKCRKLGIPPLIRPYLASCPQAMQGLEDVLTFEA